MPRIKQSDGAGKGHERKIVGMERQITVDEAGSLVVMTETEMIKRQYKLVATTSGPSIPTSPVARSITAGSSTTFAVSATGTAPLSYQWKKNGVNIPGATAASYALTNAQLTDNGAQFTCVVSNAFGSATSTAAMLTVTAVAPSITTQPVNRSVSAGNSTSFSVVAAGTAPFSYQWRRNGVDIPGATSSSYSITTTPSDNGAIFACTVTNIAGSVSSSNATLTVSYTSIGISVQPANRSVLQGQSTSFSITATGTGISYQWKKNGVNVGTNSSTYSYTNAAGADNGAVITCVVSNAFESITSNAVSLTVIYFSTQPVAPATITPTTTPRPSLSVVVSGAGPYTYQWYVSGSPIPGATASTLPLDDTANYTPKNGDSLYCVATSTAPAGSITSNTVVLSMSGFLDRTDISVTGWSSSAVYAVGVNPSSGANITIANYYAGTEKTKQSSNSGLTWGADLGTLSNRNMARYANGYPIVGYIGKFSDWWNGSAWAAISGVASAIRNEFALSGNVWFSVRNVASGQACIFKHVGFADAGTAIGFTGDYPPNPTFWFANDSYYAPLIYAFKSSYNGNALVFSSPTGSDRLRTWVNGVLAENTDNSYARPNDALVSNDGSKIVFVCANEGLPRYIHGGIANASQLGTLPVGVSYIWPLLASRGDMAAIYALARYDPIATSYPQVALLKSTDYGVTWTRISAKTQLQCQQLSNLGFIMAQDIERAYIAYYYGSTGKVACRIG